MRKLLQGAGMVLALSACSVGPDYVRPQVTTPAAWESESGAMQGWPDAQWWQGFASSELDRLIAEARQGNTDFAAAFARIRQAEAGAKIGSAPLFPSVSLGGGASRTAQGRDGGSAGARSGSSSQIVTTAYQSSLQASYQIDLFGKNRAGADAARDRLKASVYDWQTVGLTLYSELARGYFELLSVRDRQKLAEETLANAEEVLRLLDSQDRAGVVTPLEVAQQRSAVATARANLAELAQAEREALSNLALLLGRPPQGFYVRAHSLESVSLPAIAAGLPADLLQRRPDIARAEAELQAANADTRQARAARFPSIDLSLESGVKGAAMSAMFGPAGFFYTLASSINVPIFEGGRLQGQEQLSQARFDELAETYRGSVLAAFGDVENALSGRENASRQFGFAREAFLQAREAYRVVAARYRAGTVDFLSVLDAQRTVFQANDTLVQAALAQLSAAVDLYQALGGGWQASPKPILSSADLKSGA